MPKRPPRVRQTNQFTAPLPGELEPLLSTPVEIPPPQAPLTEIKRGIDRQRVALNPKEKEARRELMLMRRLCGAKTAKLAREFNLSKTTVSRELDLARQSGMLEIAKNQILQLVPKSIAVLDSHLDLMDKDVATTVLLGTGVLRKDGMQINVLSTGENDNFTAFRERFMRAKREQGETVEGAVVRREIASKEIHPSDGVGALREGSIDQPPSGDGSEEDPVSSRRDSPLQTHWVSTGEDV